METVVLSLGGSVLAPGPPEATFLKRLAAEILALSESVKLYVVTGGGGIARAYIDAGRALGAPERVLDGLGIQATRINARLLMAALGMYDVERLPHTVQDAVAAGKARRIVVMGGTDPGHTTDAVAAELAVAVAAKRIVNATSVDGVYTADPARDPTAKRLENVSYEELVRLSGDAHARAGPSIVFDPKAARIVAQSRIPLAVVSGRDLEALRNAVLGKPFRGTTVG